MQPKKINKNLTMKYEYGGGNTEYIFSYKNRPFSMLKSSNLPSPTSNFIDHLLVKEFGLKMFDMQCKKIYFGGQKLRLLGRISCTVQCISDGASHGNFQFKACVIENLNQNFDTHSIAGMKTSALLSGDCDGDQDEDVSCTYSGAFSPPPRESSRTPSSTSSTPASLPSDCSTPTRILLQKFADGAKSPVESPTDLRRSEAVRALLAARSRSPPGFPAEPQYAPSSPQSAAAVSPLSANIRRLDQMFGGADVQPHDHAQLRVLRDQDPGGQVTYRNGITNFYTSDGCYDYEVGHGRDKCTRERCYDADVPNVPHNCAFSGHWTFPPAFRSCGPRCHGAFCTCFRSYK